MSPIAPHLETLSAGVADLTARLGHRVDALSLKLTDRTGLLALQPPGLHSPNRSCRLFRAADGWMALNLARQEDRELVPAWLFTGTYADAWDLLVAEAPKYVRSELVERASLLGLPAAAVGEIVRRSARAPLLRMTHGGRLSRDAHLNVVDLSTLWAGPMCGAILAAMGASVTKIEDRRRPDPTRLTTPVFFNRLNRLKLDHPLDFGAPGDRHHLQQAVYKADVVVTSARPRAFAPLGLDPEEVFSINPGLVWVAITGYGWTGEAANRVAFGDDAAAAGGLVKWMSNGEPNFLGDALADPISGLAAAEGALRGVMKGGGLLVDVAMAGSAAAAAAEEAPTRYGDHDTDPS